MKSVFYLSAAGLALIACTQSSSSAKDGKENIQTFVNVKAQGSDHLITLSEVEKILGEKAHLSDTSWTDNGKATMYHSTHTANAKEPETGKLGNLYFAFEQHKEISSAKELYASIKKSNEDHEGIKVLNDIGDEAYFHSDGENFCFILARKGDKMIRMKVNKLTNKTSLDHFNAVAKDIVERM